MPQAEQRYRPVSPITGYGLAVVATAVAAVLRAALSRWLGSEVPFTTFYPAVMVTGWLGGLGPGIVCTVLSGAVANFLFFDPAFEFGIFGTGHAIALLLFVASGIAVNAMLG